MNRPKLLLFIALGLLLLLPLWMFLCWYFWPEERVRIAIIDKTVLTQPAQEHESLNWVLRYNRYVKPNGQDYETERDYFGFFPLQKRQYHIQDMERFSEPKMQTLINETDVAFVTDTYGIYSDDWYSGGKAALERSKRIYGGLSERELQYLKELKARKKLIITEFNTIASPTQKGIRRQFEREFGIKWSGWTGRYFDVLDTSLNKELPKWVTKNYLAQHNGHWPFKNSGIILVNENDEIEILEYGTHLLEPTPIIETSEKYQIEYGLPATMKYPFWFDIMYTSRKNDAVAIYHLKTNKDGDEILAEKGILKRFPAVIAHDRSDYRFYYFGGDFSDNPIDNRLSCFKGVTFFSPLFYPHTITERNSFFWEYYLPLMSHILDKKPLRIQR